MKTINIKQKKLSSFIIIILSCFLFFTSCENEEYEYSPPEILTISGATSVTANSTREYYTYYMDDVTYQWTVPSGASITSGQGTSQITILFGDTGGTISVEAKGMTASKEVTVL